MVTATIRNLDDDLKARSILRAALANRVEDGTGASLYAAIRARVESFGGVDLESPQREPQRYPPDFGE